MKPSSPAQSHDRAFENPDLTAEGKPRATVPFSELQTLWFNTGSVCNLACTGCYLDSSPTNHRLSLLTSAEVKRFLDEAVTLRSPLKTIGFTGGEPFVNRELVDMIRLGLVMDLEVLVLTNAMQPMQRRLMWRKLLDLRNELGRSVIAERLECRVSLDYSDQERHDELRGTGSWDRTITGIDQLLQEGFTVTLAGRLDSEEEEVVVRNHYESLLHTQNWPIDSSDPSKLVLFPDLSLDAPTTEISQECWNILDVAPESQMCATNRMILHRRGSLHAEVVPCTLIVYDSRFSMGTSLTDSFIRDGGMFRAGAVKLCHPFCSQFCVLGGARCSEK